MNEQVESLGETPVADGTKVEEIVVRGSRELTSSEEALMEFSKKLVIESVSQALDFNKTMLQLTATFATLMATVFGVLVLGGSAQLLSQFQRILLGIPIFVMLISSICFALGYYPRYGDMRPDDLTDIREKRNHLLRWRVTYAVVGVVMFILSVISLMVVIALTNFQ
jgi:hypothetical protein